MAAIAPARVALLYSPPAAATGTISATLDAFASTASGTVEFTGTVAVTLDAFTSTASGTVLVAVTGTADVTLDAFTSTATGTSLDGNTPGYVTVVMGGPLVTVTFSTDDGRRVRDYDIGDRPVATATFKDNDDVLTTPSTIVVKVQDPSGNVDTYTSPDASITTLSTGVVQFTFPAVLDETGPWTIRFKGTAGLQAAYEGKFRARRTAFASP